MVAEMSTQFQKQRGKNGDGGWRQQQNLQTNCIIFHRINRAMNWSPNLSKPNGRVSDLIDGTRVKVLIIAIMIALFNIVAPSRSDAQQHLCNHSNTDYIYAFGIRSMAMQMVRGTWNVQGFYELPSNQCITLHRDAGRADTSIAIFEKGGWFSKPKLANLRGIPRNGNKLIGWPDPSLYTNAAGFCIPNDFSNFREKLKKVRATCKGAETRVQPQFGLQSTTFSYSGPNPIVAVGVIQGTNVRVYSPKEYNRKFKK
jgi:hypothetical protein